MAEALGVRFLDRNGARRFPVAGSIFAIWRGLILCD